MVLVALKRLGSRIGLTLLSIVGVTLAIGLVISIPVFAKAVSFVALQDELAQVSSLTSRPPFSMRFYVLPERQYTLSLEETWIWEAHIAETVVSEVGLPLIAKHRQVETAGLAVRTGVRDSSYGPPHTPLFSDTKIVVLPGVASKLTLVNGRAMGSQVNAEEGLPVWIHHTLADSVGLSVDEEYELYSHYGDTAMPIRIAGTWKATDPRDDFWFQNPNLTLERALLVREADYAALAEPALGQHPSFVSWYLILDDAPLTSENMRRHAQGLRAARQIIVRYLPDAIMDSSPLEALETAIQRESDLTALLLVFSVPIIGFVLYFLSLISSITVRWQRRELAIMVSRGMHGGQMLAISAIEAMVVIGSGLPLGFIAGIQLARAMGYAESFMRFAWRVSLPVSSRTANLPMLTAALSALLVARLWPVMRATHTSVIAHEQRRARAPRGPFWQRTYLDLLLLIPVIYAYRRLVTAGTLVPPSTTERVVTSQDPLLFLVPALFTLTLSLILVRLFPLWMHIGDTLTALGRRATPYLAFRQLARQSGQYTSALLLALTSLSLGAFIASMAASLDNWLLDQVYYAVGADVLLQQAIDPQLAEAGIIPSDGAWMLPVETYLQVPGVVDATRVGMYATTVYLTEQRTAKVTFIGVDRLHLPDLLFFRSDFASVPLGELMNLLASREDAVLVSERFARERGYDVGDKIKMRILLANALANEITLTTDFTIAGTYAYFPTVYEQSGGLAAVVGNLDFLFQQVGSPMLHHVWLQIEPQADKGELIEGVEEMGVFVHRWMEAREKLAEEQAKPERAGIFGTLTIGFLAAAALSGVGLLLYNYASLQERLFGLTVLRAIGLSRAQIVSQVIIEYLILTIYSVVGGAAIGIWASKLFIAFFQAADQSVLRPPVLVPVIAWQDIARISAVFTLVLVVAQIVVISAALGRGTFQALRMGDRE